MANPTGSNNGARGGNPDANNPLRLMNIEISQRPKPEASADAAAPAAASPAAAPRSATKQRQPGASSQTPPATSADAWPEEVDPFEIGSTYDSDNESQHGAPAAAAPAAAATGSRTGVPESPRMGFPGSLGTTRRLHSDNSDDESSAASPTAAATGSRRGVPKRPLPESRPQSPAVGVPGSVVGVPGSAPGSVPTVSVPGSDIAEQIEAARRDQMVTPPAAALRRQSSSDSVVIVMPEDANGATTPTSQTPPAQPDQNNGPLGTLLGGAAAAAAAVAGAITNAFGRQKNTEDVPSATNATHGNGNQSPTTVSIGSFSFGLAVTSPTPGDSAETQPARTLTGTPQLGPVAEEQRQPGPGYHRPAAAKTPSRPTPPAAAASPLSRASSFGSDDGAAHGGRNSSTGLDDDTFNNLSDLDFADDDEDTPNIQPAPQTGANVRRLTPDFKGYFEASTYEIENPTRNHDVALYNDTNGFQGDEIQVPTFRSTMLSADANTTVRVDTLEGQEGTSQIELSAVNDRLISAAASMGPNEYFMGDNGQNAQKLLHALREIYRRALWAAQQECRERNHATTDRAIMPNQAGAFKASIKLPPETSYLGVMAKKAMVIEFKAYHEHLGEGSYLLASEPLQNAIEQIGHAYDGDINELKNDKWINIGHYWDTNFNHPPLSTDAPQHRGGNRHR